MNDGYINPSSSMLQDDQAIEPLLMPLWQKLPSDTDNAQSQLQLWWASHDLVSTSIAWGKKSRHNLRHPEVSHIQPFAIALCAEPCASAFCPGLKGLRELSCLQMSNKCALRSF